MLPLYLKFTMPCVHRICRQFVCAFMVLCVLNCWTGCSEKNQLSHLPLEEQVKAGLDSMRIFDFDLAYKTLSQAQPKVLESSDQWGMATYALGLAAWHKAPSSPEAVAEATSLLAAVVAHAPESAYAASALLDLGRIAEISDYLGEPTDVPSAQAYYKQVREQFPNSEMSARASVFLAQSMAQSFEPEQVNAAIALLNEEMEQQPNSPWLSAMSQFQAHLYAFYAHDVSAALKPYENAMELGFARSAEADGSLWQFGLFAQAAGEDFVAARVFSRLVENYPRSIYGTVARKRVIEIAKAHPDSDIAIPQLSDLGLGR